MASSPAVWGDQLVAHGMDGHVWVLRRTDGRVVSRFAVGSPIESSPVVRDGVDYFGTWDGHVYALDLRRQHVRWTVPRRAARSPRPPRIAGGTLYIGDYCGRLLALAARDRRRALGRQRQRAHLRHAGSGRRPRLRAELERRLDDGVHDRRAGCSGARTSAPTSTRRRRSGTAASSSARTAASSTPSRPRPAARSGRCPPAARSRAPPWSSTASPTRARSRTGSSASTPAPAACCSTSRTAQYVPVSGDGGRLLLHGYSRLYAVVPR